MTIEFADTLWEAMFAACLAGAALIEAMSGYISSSLKTSNPEDEAALDERQSLIQISTIISIFIFIVFILMGFPYALIQLSNNESINKTDIECNFIPINMSCWNQSLVNEGYSILLLKISYIVFPFIIIIFVILLSLIGIVYRNRFIQLSHDDYTLEDFYMNP